ncbi:MAG: single-stranded-DNA-specific exonuclease RecJ, partial [Planctomycetia bacterium]|nr:single-stranded-DNA-specific exonuclease RecJ [Planctomycetia bacterium]
INLVEVLASCAEHLESWGGHPMAVGVALSRDKVDVFRRRFADAVRVQTGGTPGEATIEIAAWLTPEQVTERLVEELESLHPFGQGNPEPVFGVRGVVLRQPVDVFKEQHFRFRFEDGRGRPLHGVAWKMADRQPLVGSPIDLAVELKWNHYNGRRLLQLGLVDWRAARRES